MGNFTHQSIYTTQQTIMRLATATLCLLCLTSLSAAAPQEGPGIEGIMNGVTDLIFGKKYDTPVYEVIAVHDTSKGQFEERRYPVDAKWVCNERIITDSSGDSGMFMKLFRYISGANEEGDNISMTKPVSMKMTQKDANNTFRKEMCFYLDSSHQRNPPRPTDPTVYLKHTLPITVYTRRVGGRMSNEDWFTESNNLDEIIAEKGFQYHQDYFIANGYDSPMQFWNRRNEVWKVKLEEE